MFDLNDEKKTRIVKNNPIERQPSFDEETEETGGDGASDHVLDSYESVELHSKLLSYYRMELDRQYENRLEQAKDDDYYDNIQWAEEDANEIRDRGQSPIVYNVISQSVNWIIGSEKRNRMEFKVLPRRKEESKPAEKKTSLLKYLADVNKSPHARSRAFEDAVKVGVGWMETAIQDDDPSEEPIYSRFESWRNIMFDSSATELDENARYIFRVKWLDVDVAKAYFHDRSEMIDQACTNGETHGFYDMYDGDDAMDSGEMEREMAGGFMRSSITHHRSRVRVVECWYRTPERVNIVLEGAHMGQIFDENDPRHEEVAHSIGERLKMRMRVAIFTTAGLLYEGPSPYRHNKFPFTPIWGMRRGRDGMPYGVIRWMRDIQDDINKRASKALAILSSNKVIMDEGAVADINKFTDEISRPDAVIEKRKGYELVINAERELAPAHLDLMSRDIQMIQQAGGVTDELLGKSSNAVSGVAIDARQEQGSVATNKFFDNLRYAEQIRGEKELSLIEQFMTEEKQFRITNQRGNADFVSVNDGLPEGDIARTKADFVMSEEDWHATVRQANTTQLVEMMRTLPPEVALVILDLVVDTMDVHNRDEIVKRIRQNTGQRDPDATEPTPEEIQAMQAQQEQQQAQKAMFEAELAKMQAEVANLQATAERERAAAQKAYAEIERIRAESINTSVTAQKSAMEAATAIITIPQIAPVADSLLMEAGWPGVINTPAPVGAAPRRNLPAEVGVM